MSPIEIILRRIWKLLRITVTSVVSFGSFSGLFHVAVRTIADITSSQCHRCATLLMVRHSFCVQRVDQRSKKKLIPYPGSWHAQSSSVLHTLGDPSAIKDCSGRGVASARTKRGWISGANLQRGNNWLPAFLVLWFRRNELFSLFWIKSKTMQELS